MSFSSDDFAKALEQHDYQFQKGQVVRGKAFGYDSDGVLIDIGGKSAAFLPRDEAALGFVNQLSDAVPLQEEMEFLIIRDQDEDGQVTLSLRQLLVKKVWERFEEFLDDGKTIQVRVTGVNKGGVTVDAQGIRGFIPRSHLVERDNLESLIGKALTVAFLDVSPANRKLVLSERQATQASSIQQLQIGQLIDGKVVGIKPFGLFVAFEGTTGLLHINQISKNYVASLDKVFSMGQPIRALILDIDEMKRRVSLSTKVLESYPGEMLDNMETLMAEAPARAEKIKIEDLIGERRD